MTANATIRAPVNIATVLGIAVALASFVFATTPVTESEGGLDSDGQIYVDMALRRADPESMAALAPWCYRVLTPYLASLLPFSILSNFRLLALVTNVLSLLTLFAILRRVGFSAGLWLLGIFLYAGVFWTLKFSFYSPAYIDYQTQLLLLLTIYLTVSHRYWLLLPVLVASGLQKESLAAYSLFCVAALLRQRARSLSVSTLLLAILLIVLPCATVLLVRIAVEAENPDSPLGVVHQFSLALNKEFWKVFPQAAFSGLGLLPVLVLLHYRPWLKFLRQSPEWIVYLVISAAFLFGGTDKSRLFLYSLPLVVVLVLCVVEVFTEVAPIRYLRIWAGMFLAAHWFIGGYLTAMGPFSEYLARMVPENSDGRYVPFLVRNSIIALFVAILTIKLIFGGFHFRPTVGFHASMRRQRQV